MFFQKGQVSGMVAMKSDSPTATKADWVVLLDHQISADLSPIPALTRRALTDHYYGANISGVLRHRPGTDEADSHRSDVSSSEDEGSVQHLHQHAYGQHGKVDHGQLHEVCEVGW